MKDAKKYYAAAWIVVVLVFHLIMFILPTAEIVKRNGIFWAIYFAILASLTGQAACSVLYAKKEKKEERFLYIPVVLISYIALLMCLLLALEAVLLSFLPTWFTVIVAVLVLAFYALSVVRTMAAAEMVVTVGQKVERQTEFMRSLTARAKAMEQNAPEAYKQQVKRVYEALRYSDPLSTDKLANVDEEIDTAYRRFTEAVKAADEAAVRREADILCALVKERNELCKIYKH